MKKQIVNITVNNDALAAVLGVKPGDTVDVEIKNDVPVIREWRNRFKDALIDNCITINQNAKKALNNEEGYK